MRMTAWMKIKCTLDVIAYNQEQFKCISKNSEFIVEMSDLTVCRFRVNFFKIKA